MTDRYSSMKYVRCGKSGVKLPAISLGLWHNFGGEAVLENAHRPDPDTPLEETMGALDLVVRQGKALYAGISNYKVPEAREAITILRPKIDRPQTVAQRAPAVGAVLRTPRAAVPCAERRQGKNP